MNKEKFILSDQDKERYRSYEKSNFPNEKIYTKKKKLLIIKKKNIKLLHV